MSVHERIRQRREELGLSVIDVAKALGVDRITVYRYESADIENMRVDKIEPLARVLKVSPAWIMGWEEDDDKKPAAEAEGEDIDKMMVAFASEIPLLPEQQRDIVIALIEANKKARKLADEVLPKKPGEKQ